eukprot:Mrub_07208.p1 GENE.Mrub_07208~~Mrub_07208.p1  ORF type:complete len:267 (+),score=29.09 Mrub_07208:43-843(+)
MKVKSKIDNPDDLNVYMVPDKWSSNPYGNFKFVTENQYKQMLNKSKNTRSEMDLTGNHHNSKYSLDEAQRIESKALSPKSYRSNLSTFSAYTNPYSGVENKRSMSNLSLNQTNSNSSNNQTPFFHNAKYPDMSPTKINHVDKGLYRDSFKEIVSKNPNLRRTESTKSQILKNSYFNPITHQQYYHQSEDRRHSMVNIKYQQEAEKDMHLKETIKWAGSLVHGTELASNRFNKKKTDVNLYYNAYYNTGVFNNNHMNLPNVKVNAEL